jgi:DNA-binding transcriptional LysR family regulator
MTTLSAELLKTFATAAELGSFTKTGQKLNMTQSAVSMQIKKLESELNALLFTRQNKKIVLTAKGHLLFTHAKKILTANLEALNAMSSSAEHGRIVVGSPENYASTILPEVLREFYEHYPNFLIDVRCMRSGGIDDSIKEGSIDLGVCTLDRQTGVCVSTEPLVWAAAEDAFFPPERPLPLAVYERGCLFRRWAEEKLTEAGIEYRIAFESQSISGIMAAVRSGLTVSPVGRSSLRCGISCAGITLNLPPLPPVQVSVLRSLSARGEAVDFFEKELRKALENRG